MPKFPIAILTDKSEGPGMHTHVDPSKAPAAISKGLLTVHMQQGLSVFANMVPVVVKGGMGLSNPPLHCPAGTLEVKEGVSSVLTTGTPTAFAPAATQHCTTFVMGPAINFILPGPANKKNVFVGGPVVGMGKDKGFWYSAFQALGLEGMGEEGAVFPADTDGSDEDAASGGASPGENGNGGDGDGTGNGADPNEEEEDEATRIYPYEATLVVDGVVYGGIAEFGVTISAEGGTETVPFNSFKERGQTGPYQESTTNVSVGTTHEGADIRFEADTSTVLSGGGGGS